jgi:hypothetical protein
MVVNFVPWQKQIVCQPTISTAERGKAAKATRFREDFVCQFPESRKLILIAGNPLEGSAQKEKTPLKSWSSTHRTKITSRKLLTEKRRHPAIFMSTLYRTIDL